MGSKSNGALALLVVSLAIAAFASEDDFTLTVDWNTIAQSHHTWQYRSSPRGQTLAQPKLVLRRGQDFEMTLVYPKDFNLEVADIILVAEVRSKSKLRDGSEEFEPFGRYRLNDEGGDFVLTLKPSGTHDGGDSQLRGMGGNLGVIVDISGRCPLAAFKLSIEAVVKSGENAKSLVAAVERPVVVLANPWSDRDAHVYWNFATTPQGKEDTPWTNLDEKHLDEFVMNEKGALWAGDASNSLPWRYGQFDPETLPVSLHLIEKCASPEERRDVAVIMRCLSELTPLVLEGRWMEPFKPQTEPWVWTGSDEIIRQYFNTAKVVRFGQCWVYAGVLTSLSRTLGLPTRAVTTVQSAHDADVPYNRAIDHYYTSEGGSIRMMSHDSIWNFHVWNEAWVKRDDLDLKYSGWNAFDATPQEASPRLSGKYRMGPTSIRAVYEHFPRAADGVEQDKERFDNSFVIGEVDAMEAHWILRDTPECQPTKTNDTASTDIVTGIAQIPSGKMLDFKLSCFDLQRVEYGVAGKGILTFDHELSTSIFEAVASDVQNQYHDNRENEDFFREEHPHLAMQKSRMEGLSPIGNSADTKVYSDSPCSILVGARKDTGEVAVTDGHHVSRIYMGEDITAIVMVRCLAPSTVVAHMSSELLRRDSTEEGTILKKKNLKIHVSTPTKDNLYEGIVEMELPALLYTKEIRNNERTVLIEGSIKDLDTGKVVVDSTEVHINDRPLKFRLEQTNEGRSIRVTFNNPAPITVHNVYAKVACDCFSAPRHLIFPTVGPSESVDMTLPISDDMWSPDYFERYVSISKLFSVIYPAGETPNPQIDDASTIVGGSYDVISSFATIDGLIWSTGGISFDLSPEEAFGFWNTAVLALFTLIALFLAASLCILGINKIILAREKTRVLRLDTSPVAYLHVAH